MRRELDVAERALEQLFRLNASRKVHARLAAAAGVVISQPGASLLRQIHEHGPLSLGELAARTHMDPAATGRQVRQLERDGLVARVASADDARVTIVRATRAGARVHQRLSRIQHQHMHDVLSAWTRADRVAFERLLARFVNDLHSVRYRGMDEAAG
jgi:DNA-binding MarR family transcriptional regulator